MGSANLANGLTAGETIGMVFVGSTIAGVMAFIGGEPGVRVLFLILGKGVNPH